MLWSLDQEMASHSRDSVHTRTSDARKLLLPFVDGDKS